METNVCSRATTKAYLVKFSRLVCRCFEHLLCVKVFLSNSSAVMRDRGQGPELGYATRVLFVEV